MAAPFEQVEQTRLAPFSVKNMVLVDSDHRQTTALRGQKRPWWCLPIPRCDSDCCPGNRSCKNSSKAANKILSRVASASAGMAIRSTAPAYRPVGMYIKTYLHSAVRPAFTVAAPTTRPLQGTARRTDDSARSLPVGSSFLPKKVAGRKSVGITESGLNRTSGTSFSRLAGWTGQHPRTQRDGQTFVHSLL